MDLVTFSSTDPTSSDKSPDKHVVKGQIWVNETTDRVFLCVDPGTGRWLNIGGINTFDDATARDAAISSPGNGELIGNKELGLQWYHPAGFWRTPNRSVLHDLNVALWLDARFGIGVADGATVGTWVDHSGNAYEAAEAANPPSLALAGVDNPYLTFNGTDQSISVPKADFVNSLQSLSVVFRCRWGTGDNGYVFGRYHTANNQRGWAIKYDLANDRWEVILSGDGVAASTGYGSELDDGAWHTVAFSFDSGTLKMFEDGEEITVGDGGGSVPSALFDSDNDLTLGNAAALFCNVDIQHAAIFNAVLTPAQMAEIHNELVYHTFWSGL